MNTLLPEWHPQQAVLLVWPHADSDWQPFMKEAEQCYVDITQAIAVNQQVIITAKDDTHQKNISKRLAQGSFEQLKHLRFVLYECNDTWVRDFGPITVQTAHQQLAWLDFQFNAWGGKYHAEADNGFTQHLSEQLSDLALPVITQPWVLEGGSIEANGAGCLLTTKQCLLNPSRNPGFDQKNIETHLKTSLGIEKILWLNHGLLPGDDTDGHIDTLARFCDPQTICYQSCDDPSDPCFDDMTQMELELTALRDVNHQAFRLIPLPWPEPQFNAQGLRLPATYANFLITNHKVLMPCYNTPSDKPAQQQLQMAFPNHEVVGINCRVLIEQFGSLHCITMQLPRSQSAAFDTEDLT